MNLFLIQNDIKKKKIQSKQKQKRSHQIHKRVLHANNHRIHVLLDDNKQLKSSSTRL